MNNTKRKKGFRRSSEIPGEYHRTSVVPVTRISFTNPAANTDGRWTRNYIVSSVREAGGVCDHTLELGGVTFAIPQEVLDRMLSHRDQTLTEQRKDQGRIQAESQPVDVKASE